MVKQKQIITLRGGYKVELDSDGESLKMEVFAPEGVKVDMRTFSHRNLTGEQEKRHYEK